MPNPNANTDSYSHSDRNGYGDANSNSHSNGHDHSVANAYSDGHNHRNTVTNTDMPARRQSRPVDAGTPVAIDHYGGFMDSDGTFAYEGGGYSFTTSGTINQFGKFNPATNTWTPLRSAGSE